VAEEDEEGTNEGTNERTGEEEKPPEMERKKAPILALAQPKEIPKDVVFSEGVHKTVKRATDRKRERGEEERIELKSSPSIFSVSGAQ